MLTDENGLNQRQRKFVKRYLETGNATLSYVQAGYRVSERSASAAATRLLAKVRGGVERKWAETGLSDTLLQSVHVRGLQARKPDGTDDIRTQAIYLDMAYRLRGAYAPEKHELTDLRKLSVEQLQAYRARVLERIAEVAMRLSVIRLEAERLVVAGNGFIQFSQVLERTSEIVVRLGIIGLDS